jgi:hypothetical protein
VRNLPIDQKKLNLLVRRCNHYNVQLLGLPKYLYSPKTNPITELLIELVADCLKYLSIMNDDEIDSLVNSLPLGFQSFLERDSTLERVAVYYVAAEISRNQLSFREAALNDLEKSEVLAVYPELRNKLDDDGLLCIDDEMELVDGGIEYRDHVLHYHQFLRREYSARPNFDFFYRFIAYYHKTKTTNQFRIAIDHRKIMRRDFYQQIIELDTWYGPPFDPEKLDAPDVIGLTIVKRNKDSLFELENSLDRTEFFWSFRDGIKTFQIEEISSLGYQFESYYLNKYVHSERDTHRKMFRHLDGAVKVYLPDNYSARLKANMPNEPKCFAKPKLFRVDGEIELEDWVELISFFYKSNEMIIEYFNPEEFENIFEERVRDFKSWKQKQGE